jgi:uncharacterized membrane protein YvbJ
MTCRSCGIEIADKALVCYRCGTSTTEATFKAPATRAPRSRVGMVATILALVLLVLLALYLPRASSISASPVLRWVIVGLAVVIIVLRGVARRARR